MKQLVRLKKIKTLKDVKAMISVALLSKWHVHAEDYASQADKNENLLIKTVWDDDEKRGTEWAEKLGVPFEPDLQKVLADQSIDAVIVSTPTHKHKEVILGAARHNKHIFTEKVLALTNQDCEEIYSAIEKAGVQLVVSLPRLTEPAYLYAQKALDEGWLGTLSMIRCRLAHNGGVASDGHPHGWLPERFFNRDESGGGALIDLGAHPIYLTNRLAGDAVTVSAQMRSLSGHEVDDNAVVLIEYASGALGVIETSFVSHGSPFQLELYGTEGVLLIEEQQVRLKSHKRKENDVVTPDELPLRLPTPMEQWVDAISGEEVPTITKEDVYKLTEMNELAAVSHREGRRVNRK